MLFVPVFGARAPVAWVGGHSLVFFFPSWAHVLLSLGGGVSVALGPAFMMAQKLFPHRGMASNPGVAPLGEALEGLGLGGF